MRSPAKLILSIVLVFQLPHVFCFTREQDKPIMQYLQRRVWNPVHSFEAQLRCKLGDAFLEEHHDLHHYGCFCGVTKEMRSYKDPSAVKEKDSLDGCCKEHNLCLKRVISRNEDDHCSFDKIKDCETNLINCIGKVKVDSIKGYKNYDRNKCK
nr:uncharacterized protein LOC131775089 [Pocillopora verrucosa]